jgi:putative FmdB family regulatory protein
MPTYEYKCDSCGNIFEKVQKMTDKPLSKCPKCGKKIKRLIGTGAGIIFKGGGFYQTDYKGSSAGKSEKDPGKKDGKVPPCGGTPHGGNGTCCSREGGS